jgi:hypothetical protein
MAHNHVAKWLTTAFKSNGSETDSQAFEVLYEYVYVSGVVYGAKQS